MHYFKLVGSKGSELNKKLIIQILFKLKQNHSCYLVKNNKINEYKKEKENPYIYYQNLLKSSHFDSLNLIHTTLVSCCRLALLIYSFPVCDYNTSKIYLLLMGLLLLSKLVAHAITLIFIYSDLHQLVA